MEKKYYNYLGLYYAVDIKKKKTISVRNDKDSPCLQVYNCIVNIEKLTPITKDTFDKVYDKVLKKFNYMDNDNVFKNKIDSSSVLYSKGNNDEYYTPNYAVLPILKYIPKETVIWCPFDTEESEFVKEISKTNKVIFSHINNGQDFYSYEPKEKWDIIISNPPFTNKRKIFERALSFNKPFALIMSNTWLNDSAPKQLFKEKDLQLLMFEQRIKYKDNNKITFSSSYYCFNFLPKQIIMERLS